MANIINGSFKCGWYVCSKKIQMLSGRKAVINVENLDTDDNYRTFVEHFFTERTFQPLCSKYPDETFYLL